MLSLRHAITERLVWMRVWRIMDDTKYPVVLFRKLSIFRWWAYLFADPYCFFQVGWFGVVYQWKTFDDSGCGG